MKAETELQESPPALQMYATSMKLEEPKGRSSLVVKSRLQGLRITPSRSVVYVGLVHVNIEDQASFRWCGAKA
ncbi:hypothetical protein AVEN_271905-1 [Araneus ventricosus]|uniref:Uncharacterized protein n=1 Tax=Araneus ventricosus TaxID=182803 RepID=A0A4Y2CBI5_ARAVE|nr:hypothetical protein AVEN_271905-1 [Araneus ventricosus]